MGIFSMGKSPRPICDVCGHKVAEMEILQSSGQGHMTVTVRCHGEEETMTLDNRFAAAMDKNTEVNRAFVRNRLGEGKLLDAPESEPSS